MKTDKELSKPNYTILPKLMARSRRIQYEAVGTNVPSFGVFISFKDIRRLRQCSGSKLGTAFIELDKWFRGNNYLSPQFATRVHGGILYTHHHIVDMDSIRIRWSIYTAVRRNPIKNLRIDNGTR